VHSAKRVLWRMQKMLMARLEARKRADVLMERILTDLMASAGYGYLANRFEPSEVSF